ncbi:GntR family transcriptional regulator [Dubosiella newyorkensis]|jgi:GntR family transcriptional regulator|uniref:GntR family transcriptional regulator n=1 Tax=Dubosiella newyorkensis TaxID=1862672 RepID=UPI002353D191|nr:GntR family transcriptional regulator [Dubosiella newyorkensis]MCI9041514.1 GntR family transcriptional regulator [Dubosiella newyorkensis]
MQIIIHTTSYVPIYEQIVDQIKAGIREESFQENEHLPSVRSLAKELKISALTVKKAYDALEEEGLIQTVHGKGSYIKQFNKALLLEEQQKEIEQDLEKLLLKAKQYHLERKQVVNMFDLMLEEIYDSED